jgi:hypothetical protein
MKEFEDWEATNNKTWTSLKTFVHGAFQCQLVVVEIRGSTSGQQECAPLMNPYALLAEGLDLNNNTMVTQMAVAATVGSTLGNFGEYICHACPPFNNDQPAHVGNAVAGSESTGNVASYGCNDVSCESAFTAAMRFYCVPHHALSNASHSQSAVPSSGSF